MYLVRFSTPSSRCAVSTLSAGEELEASSERLWVAFYNPGTVPALVSMGDSPPSISVAPGVTTFLPSPAWHGKLRVASGSLTVTEVLVAP
jgi:hypothetical protein